MADVVTIIPARGGSQGIPRKNLQEVGGKSLIARAVETCLAAELAGPVFVSTDDAEIAAAAFAAGAHVIHRPAHLATADAITDDTMIHAAEMLDARILCLVQCTSPTMTPGEIDGTIKALKSSGRPLAFAACEDDTMAVERVEDVTRGVGFDIRDPVTLRQDRRTRYAILGSVWAMDRESLLARGRMYCENPALHVVDRRRLDIDTPDDLQLARLVLSPRWTAITDNGGHRLPWRVDACTTD